jgi:hypothetical protein
MNQIEKVEPHARTLESAADAMERDGIGGDLVHGHATVLRRMAASLRADAAAGRLAHSFHASAEPATLPASTVEIFSQLGV